MYYVIDLQNLHIIVFVTVTIFAVAVAVAEKFCC